MEIHEVVKLLRDMGKPYNKGGWGNQKFLGAAKMLEQQQIEIDQLQEELHRETGRCKSAQILAESLEEEIERLRREKEELRNQ